MAATHPPRLHVLLASQSPRAVVLRRGPSNAVCSILWDRSTDQFEVAQWLRGRIYERRCDISPDGEYWIYFARGGRLDSPTKGSWTAVARVPWLKAVALHGKGDCWLGGGLFTGQRTYWLNGACMHFPLEDSNEVKQDKVHQPDGGRGGECLSVYYPRLQRDGWKLVEKLSEVLFDSCDVFEKPLARGWTLRKFAHAQVGAPPGKGCYWDEHEAENVHLGVRLKKPAWEWAERDGDSVVWAEKGRICRAALLDTGLAAEEILFDATDHSFAMIAAPY